MMRDADATPERPTVALATARGFWEVDDDAEALVSALVAAGIEARPRIWDDPDVDWAGDDLVVVRSTWDYVARRHEFLDWARRVDAVTTLLNAPDVLEWNTDKRYLTDLAAAGIAVVPTRFIGPGEAADGLGAGEHPEFVVKPSVSAGSKDTGRFSTAETEAAVDLVAAITGGGRTAMVQPYLASVDDHGETGLVYFAGDFSHAFEKGPLLLPGGATAPGLFAPESIAPRMAAEDELALGRAVVDRVTQRFGAAPLYARVDLLRDPDGRPVVLELELTEPSWFLDAGPGAAARAAAAIVSHLP